MAAELMADVKTLGVNTQQPFHAGNQVGLGRLDNEMKMIAHQAIGVDFPLRFPASFAQRAKKAFPILIVFVDILNAADGNTVANYEYDPFGQTIRATGLMARYNPMRFSTKYQDDESDLLYYGYRYLNTTSGGWLSRDPIGEKGGVNLYGFVNNAPVEYVKGSVFAGMRPNAPSS